MVELSQTSQSPSLIIAFKVPLLFLSLPSLNATHHSNETHPKKTGRKRIINSDFHFSFTSSPLLITKYRSKSYFYPMTIT
jgi:hypothetical protein